MVECAIGGGVKCYELEQEDILQEWEKYKTYLEKSIPYSSGYIEIDAYKEMIIRGAANYRMWVVFMGAEISAVCISRFSIVGTLRVMDYEILGGSKLDEWLGGLITEFEGMIIKKYGIQQFRIVGRAGWHKKLQKFGYNSSHVVAVRNA